MHVDDLAPADLMRRVGSLPHQMTMPHSFADEGRESIKALLDASIAPLGGTALNAFLHLGRCCHHRYAGPDGFVFEQTLRGSCRTAV